MLRLQVPEYAVLYVNSVKDPDLVYTVKLSRFLSEQGIRVILDAKDATTLTEITARLLTNESMPQFWREDNLPFAFPTAAFYVAVGGDGTFLETVGRALQHNLPLVGLKLGRLGFLAAMTQYDYAEKLQAIIKGACELSPRLLLNCEVFQADKLLKTYTVFNDLVLNRKNVSSIAKFRLEVNHTLADIIPADGIIVCTPSGSTAYALAAGGAIIDPQAEVLEISPICPHTLHNRSYIVNSSGEVQLSFPQDQKENLCLVIDGKVVGEIAPTVNLNIKRFVHSVNLITFSSDSFVADLEEKLKTH